MYTLKEMCGEYGLKVSGTKVELIERLIESNEFLKYNDKGYEEYSMKQIERLKIPTLKQICRNCDLSRKGNKQDFIKIIIEKQILKELYEIVKI